MGDSSREDGDRSGSNDASDSADGGVDEGGKAGVAKNRSVQRERDAGPTVQEDSGIDRIPIRLAGGRRAWIEIPSPFFSADRERLKKHIDLLLTDDEDDGFDASAPDQ
jgi:hypothetical protein